MKMSGGKNDQVTQNFLSKLYDFRQKIEVEKPRARRAIVNSRQIEEGQTVRILVKGTGVFDSRVVKNSGPYMTLLRPGGKGSSAKMMWIQTKIAVYFWREDDAGYVFDSEVLDEVYSLGYPALKITHSDSLFRTQKRKSIRTKIHKPAFLYLTEPGEPSHSIETDPGLKCFIENISDTGYAVTVGGMADAGLRVKVQFALDNAAVCVTGIVRSVDYNEADNRSLLHIEAEALSSGVRNRILGEVFGMLPSEEEDDLPFRVLDDEMAEMIGPNEPVVEPVDALSVVMNTDVEANGG
jgi:hypothetical protein